MQNNKRRRDKLWWRDPHCRWCGIETVMSRDSTGIQQPNTATLGHLDHKFDPERGTHGQEGVRRTVLACHACNIKRGRDREAEFLREK